MSKETAWLVEHPHDPRYGRASWYAGANGFTIDSLQAIRYARREDALRAIDGMPVSLGKDLTAEQHAWISSTGPRCPHCDEAKIEADKWRGKYEHLHGMWRVLGETLREFGHDASDSSRWNWIIYNELAELRTIKALYENLTAMRLRSVEIGMQHLVTPRRTSSPDLMVEILATPDDTTEYSDWLILHDRLDKYLAGTGIRGLENLLGTVTLLRDRLVEIGGEKLGRKKESGSLNENGQRNLDVGAPLSTDQSRSEEG